MKPIPSRSDKTVALPHISIGHDPISVSKEQWDLGKKRQIEVEKLLSLSKRTTQDVVEAAKRLGCSTRLIWNLLKEYRANPKLSTLIPKAKNGGRGKSRIDPRVNGIIEHAIKNFYLKNSHSLESHLVREVHYECHKHNLPKPSRGTIHSRLKEHTKYDIVRKKRGAKEARDRFRRNIGKTPKTTYPLERIQIDHTPMDVLSVDSHDRKVVGRAWLTFVEDEFSRVILGYYLTYEAPSSATLAAALAHAVLPKDVWAQQIGLKFAWPTYGIPDRIYTDNAKEFTSDVLKRGCEEWGMQPPEQRPKGMAHFGGIIERVVKTAMQEARLLPGATASNIVDKGDYKAEKHAALTLDELDLWLANYFAGEYNENIHEHHGLPPIEKWRRGFKKSGDEIGLGSPRTVNDPEKFFIDFLQFKKRKIGKNGIRMWTDNYWCNSMSQYLENEDKRFFIIKYDPRDISRIWFLDPNENKYYPATSENIGKQSIPLWEHERLRKKLREDGKSSLDLDKIFLAYGERKSIIKDAKNKKTRTKARRTRERNLQAKKSIQNQGLHELNPSPLASEQKGQDYLDDFDGDFPEIYDVEDWS